MKLLAMVSRERPLAEALPQVVALERALHGLLVPLGLDERAVASLVADGVRRLRRIAAFSGWLVSIFAARLLWQVGAGYVRVIEAVLVAAFGPEAAAFTGLAA